MTFATGARRALLYPSAFWCLACSGDSVADPPPPNNNPEPPLAELEAKITGDTVLSIPKLGEAVTGSWDGSGSERNVSIRYEWRAVVQDDPFEDELSLGDTDIVSFNFARAGLYIIELTISGGRTSAVDTLELRVNPPPLPDEVYDVPLAFFRYEYNERGIATPALYFMPNTGRAANRMFASPALPAGTLSWEPTGERLALSFGSGSNSRIYTYNVVTGEFTQIATVEAGPGTGGLHRHPSWSPRGDWIAFVADNRFPRNGSDELVIVRPDGSEQIYLSGDSPDTTDYAFSGFHPSWAPDGESIALADAWFKVGPDDDQVRRIAIFTELWSGNPVRSAVHTEDQLQAFLAEIGYTDPEDYTYIDVGANGMAWSPDGNEIAFNIVFGHVDQDVHQIIAKSAIDGSGLELVADDGEKQLQAILVS